jgi:tetrahydromethanopterin S-methyltransferase subunit C
MPGLEIPVCPRCAAENVPATTFCAECGGPLSLVATTGPFETVLMQARAVREVAGARAPSGIVVTGTWLIGLGCVVPTVALLAAGARSGRPGWEAVLTTVLTTAVVGFVVARVTRRYLASRRRAPEGPEPGGPAA